MLMAKQADLGEELHTLLTPLSYWKVPNGCLYNISIANEHQRCN